ncbi:cytochrome d ubiquinol oxidase subunit I [Pseudomonas duriflava]|uniref:Cytochrome d ubiquinol oxidase subunit I n=1 Tax=Pseudomonas duriflava TaxID=459528 RepID=A0A562QC29_9PSED|nr:cytochrome ubiquinol oxidase subunit I [Pseudomonas duriflava]TWI54284.1 cytochrome d ubiquinol oxidase subunit I [Pseudomonas duriflava]
MFGLEALDLARIQFAFTVSFHIIFPALSIGMASFLAVLEGLWLKTRDSTYRDLYHFWLKVFAVFFGMGVVSGLVMAYEFGTNWSGFVEFAGNVTGPLLTYEVLTAFFIEAGFLGVMLFGWNRVGPGLHFFSTVMVALGTLTSTFWILSSNSWMHTPDGYEIVDGRVIPINWLDVIFSPSFPFRWAHMSIAAYLSVAFLVGASAAWHLLRGNDNPAIRKMFSMAMWMALLVAPIQAMVGDAHGLNTLEHQPTKIAAIEGHWENVPGEPTPLILFGWPDMEREETRFKVEIPVLGSLILKHSFTEQIPALKDFPKEDRPPAYVVFWSFRIMVLMGLLMIATGFWSLYLRWRHHLYENKAFLRAVMFMGPSGLIAVLAGWFTTEVGRQPWVVYGLLRTKDAVSNHGVGQLSLTLISFVVVYFAVFGIGTVYALRIIGKGPHTGEGKQSTAGGPGHDRHTKRPLSATNAGFEQGHTHDDLDRN